MKTAGKCLLIVICPGGVQVFCSVCDTPENTFLCFNVVVMFVSKGKTKFILSCTNSCYSILSLICFYVEMVFGYTPDIKI